MKKIKVSEVLFFIGYIMIIFSEMFSKVAVSQKLISVINNMGIGVLIIAAINCIIINKYNYKTLIGLASITIILIIVTIKSHDNLLLKVFILSIAFGNIEFKKFIKLDVVIRIMFFITVVMLYNMGLTENYFMYREDGTMRSSMGFAHPNNFGQYLLVICIDLVLLRFNKLSLIDYVYVLLSIILINYFSNSRTSQICLGLLFLIMILLRNHINIINCKLIKVLIINSFLIFTIIPILLANNYRENKEWAVQFNDLLSNRIAYASQFLEHYDINLFGNDIEMKYTQEARANKEQPWVLDNSYLVILLRYGLIAYIIIYILMITITKDLYKRKYYIIIMLWLVYGINAMFENTLFKIQFNSLLIILASLLYKKIINTKINKIEKRTSYEQEKFEY